MKKISYWLPRFLAISLILFISMFALDVFEEPQWFLALFMHLIPSFILVILTVFAWKNEKIGGVCFLLAGLAAIIFYHSLIIAIPTLIIGVLFLSENYFLKNH